jgi:hypothetical protein
MTKIPTAVIGAVSILLIATQAYGQKQTEIYIPIGQSPGVSHTQTYIGPITGMDSSAGKLTVDSAGGAHVVTVTDKTRIWLDRSKQKLSNQVGKMSDLQIGRTVEIKYAKSTEPMVAEWIKVEVAN